MCNFVVETLLVIVPKHPEKSNIQNQPRHKFTYNFSQKRIDEIWFLTCCFNDLDVHDFFAWSGTRSSYEKY